MQYDCPRVGGAIPQAYDCAAASRWRIPAAAILAGCLTLAMLAGTAYAAKPGGPLYAARLWVEMAGNLPAEVVARAEAEISRLDARIPEAQQASTAGDGPAATAALAAYSVIVIEAGRGSGGDRPPAAAIELTVTRHVVAHPDGRQRAAARSGRGQARAVDEHDGPRRPRRRGSARRH